ncbi:MAG: hypothetical protein FJW20_07815 [Acidimicrobiia bacterium]|nr:hypothetical protein [Acidimicrobiia bacterium]
MLLAAWLAGAPSATTAELKPETVAAFNSYIRQREGELSRRLENGKFLWSDDSAERARKVKGGEVEIESRGGVREVTGGLIHDWTGAVFLPGATLDKVVSMVQNYDNHKNVYQPEVIDSKLRSKNGNDYQIHLKLLKKKVLTVVLNTEHDVRYFPLDSKRVHSRSYSRKIAELEDAGTDKEHEMPPGNDHGFLWRLNSYWRFQERDGGVWVECDAISLTRGIPTGLGWLITPILRDLPKESLEKTLAATRSAFGG